MYNRGTLYAFMSCPRPECAIGFAAEYSVINYALNPREYIFTRIIKGSPKKGNTPVEISDLSPGFEKIYNQSFHAEQIGLDEIAGVGYRKSLEFLIKDYLIIKYPDKKEDIKKTFLGICINNWVEEKKKKKTTKRAAWLGNDHTHYVKKWEDKDLNDLKILIQLTVNWVQSELLTNELDSSMPE